MACCAVVSMLLACNIGSVTSFTQTCSARKMHMDAKQYKLKTRAHTYVRVHTVCVRVYGWVGVCLHIFSFIMCPFCQHYLAWSCGRAGPCPARRAEMWPPYAHRGLCYVRPGVTWSDTHRGAATPWLAAALWGPCNQMIQTLRGCTHSHSWH